jgi:hypothetical protein
MEEHALPSAPIRARTGGQGLPAYRDALYRHCAFKIAQEKLSVRSDETG